MQVFTSLETKNLFEFKQQKIKIYKTFNNFISKTIKDFEIILFKKILNLLTKYQKQTLIL